MTRFGRYMVRIGIAILLCVLLWKFYPESLKPDVRKLWNSVTSIGDWWPTWSDVLAVTLSDWRIPALLVLLLLILLRAYLEPASFRNIVGRLAQLALIVGAVALVLYIMRVVWPRHRSDAPQGQIAETQSAYPDEGEVIAQFDVNDKGWTAYTLPSWIGVRATAPADDPAIMVIQHRDRNYEFTLSRGSRVKVVQPADPSLCSNTRYFKAAQDELTTVTLIRLK